MAPVSSGADFPLHTTGARRRPPAREAAGILAVSFGPEPAGRRIEFGASCTRKLAWLTTTCAGSHGTLTMLSAGRSSNPGVLVSTLI